MRVIGPRWTAVLTLIGLAFIGFFFAFNPEPGFEPDLTPYEISDRARRLHADSVVIDLHVDSLIWPRPLDERGHGGQVDFPRARDGGLDAFALTTPTRYFGVAGLKAFHDRWPFRTWFSPWERFLFQIERSRDALSRSDGRIRLTSDPAEIRANHREGILSVFHGIEGAHALDGELERVERLPSLGVVFVGPVHLSDNEFATSSSELGSVSGLRAETPTGLTPLGRELIARMNTESLLVDLSHASEAAFFESLELTTLPPIVSHAGARGAFDSWRNLSDAQIRAIAERNGVIGVMLAPPALAEAGLENYYRHLEHVVAVGGEETIAIGSDFDGYVTPPFGVDQLERLTERMVRAGWTDERIQGLLGENVLRVLEARQRHQDSGGSGGSGLARSMAPGERDYVPTR